MDLYIDCDGVILGTITFAFSEMKRLGIDLSNDDDITKYFIDVDWNYLIEKGGILNNSLEKINIIKNSNLFNLVCVLTHRCSYQEGVIKTNRFKENIPNVQVITVPKKIKKHFAVNARGNYLIDDAKDKVLSWIEDGGIGVLFNPKVDHLIFPYESSNNEPYFITNDLLDILEIQKIINEIKVYKKARN